MHMQSPATQPRVGVSDDRLRGWQHDGYFRVDGFVGHETCHDMLERARELARNPAAAKAVGIVTRYETDFPEDVAPEHRVSKLFRLHRQALFREFCTRVDVLNFLYALVGPDADVFSSQLVFKVPGSSGQPWHQDAVVYPFEPTRPVVGLWLAVTDATAHNSCLKVVPGSHVQPLLPHTREEPDSNGRYLALSDPDTTNAQTLLMRCGDLFVFDSHLIHSTTDNRSDVLRAAAVWHFAKARTIDRTAEQFGHSPFNEWMPVLRSHPTL
jgi:ectoine hydroxylase-related dioxygenase (phytanoyl-CoA dioxygenase family)